MASTPAIPPNGPVTPAAQISEHLTLGNPSGATTNPTKTTNYLLSKPYHAVSYHRDPGIPNWANWHLSTDWRGCTARQDNFRPDTILPGG